jgi:D-alanyl-lipoteichoic acid acyltransferase DltB (MBOAT superfamily)
MLFTSFTYVYFFAAVFVLKWALPARFSRYVLLVASYVFYLSWGLKYGLLLAAATIASFYAAERIAKAPERKKLVLVLSLVALLGVLGLFKYADFFAQPFTGKKLGWALPLGISFYTFEMISYLVDVYRGTPRARSLLDYFLYISYFPHLVAGPIVRATELLPKLEREPRFDSEQVSEGMFVALVGFVKKVVLADNLAVWATVIFGKPEGQPTAYVWLGVAAYAGQIFCDFSGYTDIARGCSLMLGYPLPDNFDYPYASKSITEFWRRWHKTLSRWLRDYLYVSLGGNRHGKLATYRNLFLTMLLGGLWHGARWTFVVWGAYHGVLLALHKVYTERTGKLAWAKKLRATLPYQALSIAFTLLLVCVGWVFFRADSFDLAFRVLRGMVKFVPIPKGNPPAEAVFAVRLLIVLVFVHLFGVHRVGLNAHRAMPPAARGLLWSGLVALVYLFAGASPVFIYFNF